MVTKSELDAALRNPDEFKRIAQTFDDLKQLKNEFPEQANQLIKHVVSNLTEFQRIVRDNLDLTYLLDEFPQQTSQLIQLLISNRQEFIRIIQNAECLTSIVDALPEESKQLISTQLVKFLLSEKDEFIRIIENDECLTSILGTLPEELQQLILTQLVKFLLSDEFTRITKNTECPASIVDVLPEESKQLISDQLVKLLLSKKRKLKRIIENAQCLASILDASPEKSQQLISDQLVKFLFSEERDDNLVKLFNTFPQQAIELIQLTISNLNEFECLQDILELFLDDQQQLQLIVTQLIQLQISDPKTYKQIVEIETADNLGYLGREYPEQSSVLIQITISNHNEYKRLIKAADSLFYLLQIFPQQTVQLIQPLMRDDELFKQIVEDAACLDIIIDTIPEEQKTSMQNQIMQFLIDNPEEFKRLAQTDDDFFKLKGQFPNQEIFQQENLESAFEKLKSFSKTPADVLVIETDVQNSSLKTNTYPNFLATNQSPKQEKNGISTSPHAGNKFKK